MNKEARQERAQEMAREYLDEYCIGVRELAWLCGTSKTQCSKMLKGEGTGPVMDALDRILEHRVVPPDSWTLRERRKLSDSIAAYGTKQAAAFEEASAVQMSTAAKAASEGTTIDRPTRRLLRTFLGVDQ